MGVKSFYKSKTFWFNVLYLIVIVAGLFGFSGWQPSEEDRSTMEAIAVLINAVVNLLLRFKTDRAITL